MAAMSSRRLIFVRPRRQASLAPIWWALLVIAVVSVAGLVAALWPADRPPELPQASSRPSSTAPFEGSLLVPARPREQPGRTRGI
jgi:hypothetical protein